MWSIVLPELGAKVVVKGERSEIAMERCIDVLIGTGWKDVEIQGEVIAKPKKNTRRVKWHIGDQYFETEHAAAFWKKMGESSIPSCICKTSS